MAGETLLRSKRRTEVSSTERMQGIVMKYRDAGRPWPALKTEIAKWAVQNELMGTTFVSHYRPMC